MTSFVSTVVVIWTSSVGGSPTVATLRTPPIRGVSWARRSLVATRTMRAGARTSALLMVEPSRWPTIRPSQAAQLLLRLLQPGPHVHRAVHRRGGRAVFAGVLPLACAPVELAEAEVAVGDERAHAELVGEGHGLPVGGFGLLGIRGIAMRGDLAQSPESPRLVRPTLVVTGKIEGLTGKPDRILDSVGHPWRQSPGLPPPRRPLPGPPPARRAPGAPRPGRAPRAAPPRRNAHGSGRLRGTRCCSGNIPAHDDGRQCSGRPDPSADLPRPGGGNPHGPARRQGRGGQPPQRGRGHSITRNGTS